ncbi:hypothetical protein [Pedobacter sp.]
MNKLIIFILASLPFLASSQDIDKHYKIYDVKKQQLISIDAIVADMAKADVLFFIFWRRTQRFYRTLP